MNKLFYVLIFLGSPAFSAGLEIQLAGEGVRGTVKINLLEKVAPLHVTQITTLAADGAYNGVVFHRVIEGFMAQTGDVRFGKNVEDMSRAGMGGSDLPNVEAEFSDVPFDRGVVGMARSQSLNSANSQFFIMFAPGYFLNGKYTVIGRVTEGMELIDQLKLGHPSSGAINGIPDLMVKVNVTD
jgi:peptidylprolyl isomerase